MGDLTRILSDTGRNRGIPLVWNAYQVAARAHRGQRRVNGDRYISHPVEVATIVAHHGGTVPAICTALLHDVVDDAAVGTSHLHAEFGPEIATMVAELSARTSRADELGSQDLMLVAVADRLHNLRTLRRTPVAFRQGASLDTLVFQVPLAHRLNLPAIAEEMTGLSCAALDSLDRPSVRERRRRITTAVRRADPRWVAQAVATFGGGAGAAAAGSSASPEWALATGGVGVAALAAALLFSRDPRAANRLAKILAAWRRD
jgi:GTP pyrophosphokinase